MDDQHFALLEKALEADYVPHLPPLLDQTKPAEEQRRKNLSRALSAFALSSICKVPVTESVQAVIDDFEDSGIDAVYLHAETNTLYLVQSKLKATSQFKQEDALSFCQGIRRLVSQDLDGFNAHLQARRTEIEDAITDCAHIRLVVAHTGEGLSVHAKDAISELLKADDIDEERFDSDFDNFDQARAIEALQGARAIEKINTVLALQHYRKFEHPRLTYFGIVTVDDLVALHRLHGSALYDRNIRLFLGTRTPINQAIRSTLANSPEQFVHLNNGVTVLAGEIAFKGSRNEKTKLSLRHISVVNGAQTIATSARFKEESATHDISAAKVFLTIIKANPSSTLGKEITRARNHQNPVEQADFAALDDLQEVLRREIAVLGFHYAYKAAAFEGPSDPHRIYISEAAQALALLHSNVRFPSALKKSQVDFLDMTGTSYPEIFQRTLTGLTVINAVLVNRYIQRRFATEARQAHGFARLVSAHGNLAAAWILMKRLKDAIIGTKILETRKLETELSRPLDELRQILEDEARKLQPLGPLAIFRNLGTSIDVLREASIRAYELSNDAGVVHKRAQQRSAQDLFDYVLSKAPQIGNLA